MLRGTPFFRVKGHTVFSFKGHTFSGVLRVTLLVCVMRRNYLARRGHAAWALGVRNKLYVCGSWANNGLVGIVAGAM